MWFPNLWVVAPTSKAAADFEQIIKENPLFKDMVNHVVLKQTADGQLVLEEKGQGLSAEAPKPILAVVKTQIAAMSCVTRRMKSI